MHAAQAVPQLPELQESVARLCQAWWGAEVPGREALVAQALPYLILRALTTGIMQQCHHPVQPCACMPIARPHPVQPIHAWAFPRHCTLKANPCDRLIPELPMILWECSMRPSDSL